MQPIADYEGLYEITKDGQVWSHPKGGRNGFRGMWMSPVKDGTGYFFVYLKKNGNRKAHKIHRLIANAFIPNPSHYPEINHKDGVKTNNSVDNLEWVTHSQNMLHAHRTGLNQAAKGIKNGFAKLDEKQVLEIRRIRDTGMSYSKIATMFNVAKGTVVFICLRQTWRHI